MVVHYKELIDAVSKMTGLDYPAAKTAAEATVVTLARGLPDDDRRRLLAELPLKLYDDFLIISEPRNWSTQAEFAHEVAQISRRTPEQARIQAQAVLSAIAGQDPELVGGLTLPDGLSELFTPPGSGGGVTGPRGGPAPLTDEEIAAALGRLPDWTGDRTALRRTIMLPQPNLDRVLDRILRTDLAGGSHRPEILRHGDSAELVLRTASADAVTAFDVDLAGQLDDIIDAAAAGIASPYRPR
jgi:pterin-4a-carbinolamine dehydratase/uncharacterized protein (DUF2267 family)